MLFRRNIKWLIGFILAICLAWMLAGCGDKQQASVDDGQSGSDSSEGESAEGSDQSDEGDEDGEGDDSGDGSQDGNSDPLPIMISCPSKPTEMFIVVNHTWDFSPNRDLEKMRLDGKTATFVSCPLTVDKSEVVMPDCFFPYTSNGYVQTDEGKCTINASGSAMITVEDASCTDGVITMTIIDVAEPDGGYSGTMVCPGGHSQEYIPFYPYSLTTRFFKIAAGGYSQGETMDPDLSNQFRYTKEWILFSENQPVPENEVE